MRFIKLIWILILLQPFASAFCVSTPLIKNGIADFSTWSFQSNGIATLNGDWEFYWMQLLTPVDFFSNTTPTPDFIDMPSPWNDFVINGKPIGQYGFATYRLNIILSNTNKTYGLYLHDICHSFKLWVDGNLLSESGVIGTNAKSEIIKDKIAVVYFKPERTNISLVVQVGNHSHRVGGIRGMIEIGLQKDISLSRTVRTSQEILLLGLFFSFALYFLLLFYLRKREYYYLYFALLCFIFGFRILFNGEFLILSFFPGLSWAWRLKLEYITLATSLHLALLFFTSVFTIKKTKPILYGLMGILGLLNIYTLIVSPTVFSNYAWIYFATGFIIMLYMAIVSIVRLKKRPREAIFFLGGLSVFLITFLIDVLKVNSNTQQFYIIPIGFLAFIFSQIIMLSMKFRDNFNRVEVLSSELQILNTTLEKKVKARTEELLEANTRLEKSAFYDHLTGIPNRLLFYNRLEHAIHLARRNSEVLALFYLDLDGFKAVNDTFGHDIGDRLLVEVTERLKVHLRQSDTFARLGGDEFVLLCPNLKLPENAHIVSQKIINIISNTFEIENNTISIGTSIGISIYPSDSTDADHLVNYADRAMYAVKKNGKNHYQFYSSLNIHHGKGISSDI